LKPASTMTITTTPTPTPTSTTAATPGGSSRGSSRDQDRTDCVEMVQANSTVASPWVNCHGKRQWGLSDPNLLWQVTRTTALWSARLSPIAKCLVLPKMPPMLGNKSWSNRWVHRQSLHEWGYWETLLHQMRINFCVIAILGVLGRQVACLLSCVIKA
jgi:hypothetical protein